MHLWMTEINLRVGYVSWKVLSLPTCLSCNVARRVMTLRSEVLGSRFCHWLVMWTWTAGFTFLGLSFLICTMMDPSLILWSNTEVNQTNQSSRKSTLNICSKNWCWSWSSNTLATWCKELTHSLEKTLMLGKIEGRRRGRQRMRWLDGITNSLDICTYVSSLLNLPPTLSHLYRLLQSTSLISLSHTVNFHWLSIVHMIAYMLPYYSLHSSHPLLPPQRLLFCSLCLHLHCCSADRFISTIFLDSIYMC